MLVLPDNRNLRFKNTFEAIVESKTLTSVTLLGILSGWEMFNAICTARCESERTQGILFLPIPLQYD